MSYTHYWKNSKAPTAPQWARVCDTMKAVMATGIITRLLPPIQWEYDEAREPEFSAEQIHFNGVEDDAHETFLVLPIPREFDFCKTNRKPYDLLVMINLIVMNTVAPDVWEITSDGTLDDWLPALKVLRASLATAPWVLPPKLLEDNKEEPPHG